MTTTIDIGTLVTSFSGHRPMITGTPTSVRRVIVLYKQGESAEDIARRMSHLTLAQVYAALAYYHVNQAEIEADLTDEESAYEELAAMKVDGD